MAFHGVEVTLAAADAGVNLVEFAFLDLVCPVGIRNEAVTDGDQVDKPVRNGLFSHVRVIEFAVGHEGDVTNDFPHHGGGLEVKADRLVDGAYHPPTARVGTAAKVDHIYKARISKVLCYSKAFFYRALVVAHTVKSHLYSNGVVLTARPADLFNNLSEKTLAVFKASTVLIGTVVPLCGGELVDEVTTVGMYLYDINTGVLGQLCRLAHGLNEALDALGRKLTAYKGRNVIVRNRAGRVRRRMRVYPVHTAYARGELDAKLGAVKVYTLGHELKHINVLGIGEFLARCGFKLRRRHNGAGQNEAAAAFCSLTVVLNVSHVESVGSVGGGTHRRHYNAVLKRHAANFDRFKQLVHKFTPSRILFYCRY